MRENAGRTPPTTLGELAALLTPVLPEDWRHDVRAALVSDTLVLSFDDAEGRRHAFSMRRMRPEMPTLVPSTKVAFAHEPVDAALDERAMFEPYRDALTALAAHEDDILACLPGATNPTPATTTPGPAPGAVSLSPPAASTTDPAARRFAAAAREALPAGWRHDVVAVRAPPGLFLHFRDDDGRRHAFNVHPLRPGGPALVQGASLAYSYLSVDEAVDPGSLIDDYRAALTALSEREPELLPLLTAAYTADEAGAGGATDNAAHDPEAHGPVIDEGPEWLAFEAGLKAAIRVVLPQHTNLAELEQRVHARSWGFFAPEHALAFTGGDQHLAYVARDDAAARALAEAERASLCDDREERARRNAHVGRLLGYPECCAEAFAERMRRGVTACLDGTLAHEDYAAAEAAAQASGALLGRLNNLLPDRAHPRLITWYPCRYDCPASAAFAAALLGVMRDRSPDLAASWSRALVTRCAIDRRGRRLVAGESSDDDPLWLEFSTF